jgi:diadenosine tetraphosphate (Ap4A) HIT family hydrolase
MFISKDITQFKHLFVNQLKNILSPDELGAFILVLANSQQDSFLKEEFLVELDKTFSTLKDKFISGELTATQDDSDVFKQLVDVDLNDIACWQSRTLGNWEVTLNSMRKLRPARASNETLTSIHKDFDNTKFHFNKPFLKPEILWQGSYTFNNKSSKNKSKTVRVLYNKFPFSDYHLLLAISPEKNLPQFLTQEMHAFMVSMVNEVAIMFPGFGVGFNSLAAGASVNHLHFQGFIREEEFPIEKISWEHNGGDTAYPLQVKRFADNAWPYIESLIEKEIAFNCVYRKNACYVVPRRYQGSVDLPDWLQGAGWLDVAGVMTLSDDAVFSLLDEQLVAEALGRMSIY